jgi:hypothetical protein
VPSCDDLETCDRYQLIPDNVVKRSARKSAPEKAPFSPIKRNLTLVCYAPAKDVRVGKTDNPGG